MFTEVGKPVVKRYEIRFCPWGVSPNFYFSQQSLGLSQPSPTSFIHLSAQRGQIFRQIDPNSLEYAPTQQPC
jgi:hypothetical protein